MDLFHLRLLFLVLFAAGCCYCTLLPPESSGVIGKNVSITATIPPEYQSGMVMWTFSAKSGSESVYTYAFGRETVGLKYLNRVSYNLSTSTLLVRDLKSSDSGTFILQIVAEAGQLTEQTVLSVLESVSSVKISSNVSEAVEFNSTVVLSCTAQGSLLAYKWLNGSTIIVADGKHVVQNGNQLTINEVLRTDLQGPIYCVAENNLESAKSAPFNLTVNYGPDFVNATREPNNDNLKIGSNLTLTCSATSSPTAELKWFTNGKELKPTTGVVSFQSLKVENSGNYSCIAFNSKTNRYASSQVFTVSVLEAISGTNISGPVIPLIAGQTSCNLTCTSRAGKVDNLNWLKNGKPLEVNKRITLTSDKSTITISPVSKDDTGLYTCQMSNKVNTDSSNFSLTIHYGPENVVIQAPKQIEVGRRVVMNCTAASYPLPKFSWKFNETDGMVTGSQYTIENSDYMNTGKYTCIATNNVTGISNNITHEMVVKGAGELNDQLSDGAIAGIIIAVLLILAIIIGVICCRKKKTGEITSPY